MLINKNMIVTVSSVFLLEGKTTMEGTGLDEIVVCGCEDDVKNVVHKLSQILHVQSLDVSCLFLTFCLKHTLW